MATRSLVSCGRILLTFSSTASRRNCLQNLLFGHVSTNNIGLFRGFFCGASSLTMKNNLEVKNPSNFKKIEYAIPKDAVGRVLGREKQTVNEIKALSGSVIRLKKHEDSDDDPNCGYFIIGGSDEQIQKAIQLIDDRISKKSSAGYNEDGDAPIWAGYRRNFKGQFPPKKSRKQCIRFGGKSVAGNPCPLCRLQIEDSREVDYKDVKLLKQFICPHTWKTLESSLTGLCRKQQRKLEEQIEKSKLYGFLPFTVPIADDSPVQHKPVGIPSKIVRVRH